jgi:hypothetical protein
LMPEKAKLIAGGLSYLRTRDYEPGLGGRHVAAEQEAPGGSG